MKKLFTLLALFAFAFTFAACEAQEETLEVDQSTIADAFIVDEFDLSDIELTYTVNEDAQTIVLEEGMLTDDVPNTVGVHTLEVTYENAVTSFDIELVEADDDEDEDEVKEGQYLQFRYRIEDGEATLTEVMDFEILSVAIPEEIHGAPVTAIGEGALNEHARTHTITIPGSVEYIAEGAFVDTPSLSSVIIEGDMPAAYENSFSGLSSTLLFYVDGDQVDTFHGDDTWSSYAYRTFSVEDQGDVFVIVFDADIDVIIDYAGEDIEAPAEPTPPDEFHYFNGWYSDQSLETEFTFDVMPESNTYLYHNFPEDYDAMFGNETLSIEEVLALENAETATTRGIVTAITDHRTFFIEDHTGAIAVYTTHDSEFIDDLNVGDLIELTGERGSFNGLEQVSGVAEVEVVANDFAQRDSVAIDDLDWTDETVMVDYLGKLVNISNVELTAISSDQYDNVNMTIALDDMTMDIRYDSRLAGSEDLGAFLMDLIDTFDALEEDESILLDINAMTLGWRDVPRLLISDETQITIHDNEE